MELLRLRELRETLNLIGDHYKDQKTIFSQLFEFANALTTAEYPRLYPEFAVESHLEKDYFDVHFVGRCFRFAFQLYWNAKEGPVTKLSCCEIFSTELDIKPKPIYEISIDRRGVTDSSPASTPGAYRTDCTNGNDALRLILQGVFSGLAEI